eukprot:1454024-Lingulodinium_polyedra.AAC.1
MRAMTEYYAWVSQRAGSHSQGCEVWISRSLPLVNNGVEHYIQPSEVVVCHSEPTIIALVAIARGLKIG